MPIQEISRNILMRLISQCIPKRGKVPSDVSLTPPKSGSSVWFCLAEAWTWTHEDPIKFDQFIPLVTGLQPW